MNIFPSVSKSAHLPEGMPFFTGSFDCTNLFFWAFFVGLILGVLTGMARKVIK